MAGWLTRVADTIPGTGLATSIFQAVTRLGQNGSRPGTSRIVTTTRTSAGVPVNADNAVRLAAVWACLRYLSQTVAVLPWHVHLVEPGKGSEIQYKNTVDWLLWKRPSNEWSSFQFRETLLHWALRWGNGYAEIERDQLGRPFAMWPIHPERVEVCRDTETGELFYEVSNGTGPKVQIGAENMFHIRGFGEGPVGVNVIQYASESLGWAAAAQLFGASFFGNGAHVAGVVTNKKPLSLEGLKRQRAEFAALHRGGRNAHGTAHLDNEADYHAIGSDPTKAQLIEANQFLIEEIARWFGVPLHKIAHLLRATFCLPADAQVATETGPKRIADVKVGDRVWSMGPDGGFALKPVLRSGPTGESRILTIKTRGRTLRANAQHRVLVRREVMEPATKGRGPYTTIDGARYRKAWRNVYVPAGEIKIGDKLIAVDALPEQESRQAPTREATVEFMELLGHLIGDGFYFRNHVSRTLSGFGISHAVNDDCAPHYVAAAESVFAQVERYQHGRPAVSAALKAVARDPNTTTFHSVGACAELEACGVVGTAKTKRVPAWIFTLAPDLQLAFLRGYLDADGTVNQIGQIRYVSCNRALLEDVRQVCMNVGIRCGEVFGTERRSAFEGYTEVTSTLFGLILADPAANARIGSNDPMRRNRLAAAQVGRRQRTAVVWGYEAKRRDVGKGVRAAAVVSISVTDDVEEVFDLTVADNHCFIADGVVVHNSNIEHQAIEVVVDSITPWVKRFEDEADFKLFGENRRGLYTKMNLRGLLRGDFKSQNEGLKIAREAGVISANEWRDFLEMNAMPASKGGDKYIVQSHNTTLEKIGEDVQPPAVEALPPPANDDDETDDNDEEVAAAYERMIAALGEPVHVR